MNKGMTMNKVMVLGSSGATGRLVVSQLLKQNVEVVAILRPSSDIPIEFTSQDKLKIIKTEITDLKESILMDYLADCDGVISCLGHNLTFKGMFGHPKLLVTNSIEKVCRAIERAGTDKTFKLILMNTTGNSNRDLAENPATSQKIVISILRLLLPPHVDNEKAADYLRLEIGQNHKLIEWAAVRPDSLTDSEEVTQYDLFVSPTRNAIFDAAPTSRVNVANFMSRLICDDTLWNQWKGKMPVIYNHASE
ncbi:MAG: SDR family oxidoreductase [Pseudomonadales bacterium]|nr:SDR family oxidoreductase [Pseudomonadales bacterium]